MSYETLDLPGNGWHLQRGYRLSRRYAVEEDQRELGNVSSVAVAEKPLRSCRGLRYRGDSRAAAEYVQSFFDRKVGPAARFYFAWPELVSSPDAEPTLEAVAGGSQAERTITIVYAWKTSSGRTRASPVGSLLVPANNLCVVTVPVYPPSVSQCVVYGSDTGGTPQEQTVLSGALQWTTPNAALLLATADPETVNAATESPLCKLVGDLELTRLEGLNYELVLDIEEVYSA